MASMKMGSHKYFFQLEVFVIPSSLLFTLSYTRDPTNLLEHSPSPSRNNTPFNYQTLRSYELRFIMPGLLGTPTFAKMSVDAVGRLWRRLKDKKQGSKQVLEQIVEEALEQGPTEGHEQGIEQEQHTFYSDSLDTIGYSSVSDPDTLACVEFVQGWVNGTTGTCKYHQSSSWRTLS